MDSRYWVCPSCSVQFDWQKDDVAGHDSLVCKRKSRQKQTPKVDQDQVEFEEWLTSLGREIERCTAWAGEDYLKPTYRSPWVEAQWTGWKARATKDTK